MISVISVPARRRTPPWFGREARRALAAGLAVAALALGAGWPYWRGHPAAAAVTLGCCAGIAAQGVLLATGGRTRRTGLLFLAASVCWAVNWLASWDAYAGPILSPYAQAGFFLALGVGVLMYPDGRLEYTADRIWTVLAVLILMGGPTALWVTSEPEWAAFHGSTVWWPAPFPDAGAFETALRASAALYVFLALSFAAVLLLRLPRMGRFKRLLTLPVTAALAFVGLSAALTQRPVMEPSIALADLLHVYAVQGAVATLIPCTLLASGLRLRIAELTVAGRMLRLTAPVTVERVRAALRDVLRDPTLELWFWAPAERAYVDASGRPADLTGSGAARVAGSGASRLAGSGRAEPGDRWRRTVRADDGGPLAVVEFGGALRDHASLVEAALAAGGRALETARLQAAVHANLERVRAAYGRLVRAEAAERERLARDLHDGAQQRLLALGAMLGTLEAVTTDPAVKRHTAGCRRELMTALAELRALAREVRPALLVQDGLGPALEVAAERIGVRVVLDVPTGRLPPDRESALYGLLCETLSYAVERAGATRVTVCVRPSGPRLVAEVGLDGEIPVGPAADLAGRVGALRGHLEIDGGPGTGTTVRMVLPCE
ncbi:histidine kinase [Spirillospora albida]|uniref:histidine kinase n=1 Tax=Spirillospora albida TaxID=58123 RepID=UPI00068F1B0B|nr:histidine kinase [Spirillospora albida]